MDIDLIQFKIIFLIVSITSWLPQLLITDALKVETNHSCENGPETGDTRSRWPAPINFDPYDGPSSSKEFTLLVSSISSTTDSIKTPKSSKSINPTKTSPQVEATPHISRFIGEDGPETGDIRIRWPAPHISRFIIPTSSLPSLDQLSSSIHSKNILSHLPSADELLSSKIMVEPTPSLSSSVQSTPIIEFITDDIQLVSSIYPSSSSSSSSPVNSSPVVNFVAPSLISSFSSIVNHSDTLHASHTVTPDIPANQQHPNGHQPSRSSLIYRVRPTVVKTPNRLSNGYITTITTINYDNVTFDKIEKPTTLIDFSSSLANPIKDSSEIINETSLSHNMSPTSSSFFPALSGTISFIPSDPTTDSPTTDFTFTPIDNIYYNNNNETDNNNHHEGDSQNHHGIPEAATSNTTKCDPRENRFIQPTPESGFLVRSVLKRYDDESPLSLDNLTTIFETRLADLFNLAYRNQLKGLRIRPDGIKKDVHVKLWNLFWNNSTNDFHLIYQIEQDNHKLVAQDLQTLLSHISPEEMSTILGYNGTIKAEAYVNTSERKSGLASVLEDLEWLPLLMIFLSIILFIFCTLLTLIVWRKNRRLRSSSPSSSSGVLRPPELGNTRLKMRGSIAKPVSKLTTKESLVNWRKVSGPGSKRSFLGSHGGSAVGLNISGGCSATSGTIDSNHEFEYLSFDSPTSSLKLRTAEYRPRRSYSSFANHGSQSRLELNKEKVIPIGELDEIAEISSNSSSHDVTHPHHSNQQKQHAGSRITYVTTKEEMIGDYENPLMRSGVDEVDCSVPQLIQVHISEQTQNIIQAIRSELKKFNPITGTTNVQSQSQSIPNQHKESTSDA